MLPRHVPLKLPVAAMEVVSRLLPHAMTPTAVDAQTISERQMQMDVQNLIVVEKMKCKHGFPRAMVRAPFGPNEGVSKSLAPQSGMLRLTCPHLMQLVDDIENDGGIEEMNAWLQPDESKYKKQSEQEIQEKKLALDSFHNSNAAWSELRQAISSEEEKVFVTSHLGEEGAKHFFESGIIGITKGRVDDVKCLHAHVADELLRGENLIGKKVLAAIEKSGHDPRGCEHCWQQCDVKHTHQEGDYWYTPQKNVFKLRRRRSKRKQSK